MTEKKTIVMGTRVNPRIAELVKKHCNSGGYVNVADFIRDAIREKIRRDASELLKRAGK